MTDPKPARAAGEQTFEEWYEQADTFNGPDDAADAAWHARDQAVKHLEERIAELECQLGIEQKGAVGLLERIERVRALAEKWHKAAQEAKHAEIKLAAEIHADELERTLSEE